jgi:hypothetical protein
MNVWNGVVGIINARIGDGSFGASYPEQCPDGRGVTGTDTELMGHAVAGYFPAIRWPLRAGELPEDPFEALDIIEFCYEKVAKPRGYEHHGFFGHDHLDFDVNEGRREFLSDVNRLFERNGLVFNLEDNGQVIRVAPAVVGAALQASLFKTGDAALDELLETARTKFLSHDLAVRKESLESSGMLLNA